MAGRFGKYGDTKRKARLRKSRLSSPDLIQLSRKKTPKAGRKKKKHAGDQRARR